jgi:hypothetical protein
MRRVQTLIESSNYRVFSAISHFFTWALDAKIPCPPDFCRHGFRADLDAPESSWHPTLLRYPVQRAGLESRTVDDEVIVLDPGGGRVHHLNPSATYIWHRCDGRHSASDIATELAKAYGEAHDKVLADVLNTIAELGRQKLIEDVP